LLVLLLAVSAGASSAEDEAEQSAITPSPAAPQELDWQLPENVEPRAGNGEALLVRTNAGKEAIVRLHCELGPKRAVISSTGKLLLVDTANTRPTDKPFRGASVETIKKSLSAMGLKEFKFAEARPYLFCYACSEAFYLHTRSLFETAYPGIRDAVEQWGLKVEKPPVPLVVIIMPSREAFRSFRPVPNDVVAYYDMLTNHVVLYEDPFLAWAAPELALKEGAYTVVHEAVHQILANLGVQRRLAPWPMWISEGLAEYFCPVTVNSKVVKTDSNELPVRTLKWSRAGMQNDLRMYSLLKVPAKGGSMIQTVTRSNRLNSNGYAMAWGLVHYLATQRKKQFQAYLSEVSQLTPLAEPKYKVEQESDPLFVKHFGDNFAALERSLQKYLTSEPMQKEYRDPIRYQTHYVVKKISKYGKSFQVKVVVTTSPDAAKRWKEAEETASDDAATAVPPKFYTIQCKTKDEAMATATRLGKR